MRKYELFCLLKAGFDMENTDQIVENIENTIKNMGGNIIESNKMGRKRLGYEIAGNRDAFCVTFNIELDPEKLNELKRYFKLNDSVLRNFITVVKKSSKTMSASA